MLSVTHPLESIDFGKAFAKGAPNLLSLSSYKSTTPDEALECYSDMVSIKFIPTTLQGLQGGFQTIAKGLHSNHGQILCDIVVLHILLPITFEMLHPRQSRTRCRRQTSWSGDGLPASMVKCMHASAL